MDVTSRTLTGKSDTGGRIDFTLEIVIGVFPTLSSRRNMIFLKFGKNIQICQNIVSKIRFVYLDYDSIMFFILKYSFGEI